MSKHRFFLPKENFKDNMAFFPSKLETQIKRVLRLKQGDKIEVLDGSGKIFQACLIILNNGSLAAQLISRSVSENEPLLHLTLNIPLTQRDKFEWMLQKGTEIGVKEFQPFYSSRTLLQANKKFHNKNIRWQEILREAAEQSGRAYIPEIHQPVSLYNALNTAISNQHNAYVALNDQKLPDLKSVLKKTNQPKSMIHLFTGPEGGFDPSEIEFMIMVGAILFQMGKRVLRMETAAIVASALVMYELGEMRA